MIKVMIKVEVMIKVMIRGGPGLGPMIHAHEISCVYTTKSLVYTQEISCACATLLCMLWARDPRGQGPKKGAGPVPGPGSLAQSMHKSVVHAQEISCVYTRDSFVYTQ